jgi:hypothetical protein
VFRGQFQSGGVAPHPVLALTARPYIRIEIMFGRERILVPFMIDTGADFTIIQPRVASQVLQAKDRHAQASDPDIVHMFGIGKGTVPTRVRTVGLLLSDDDGERYWFTHPVLLVDSAGTATESTHRTLPSLLGRDVLRRFDLNLSYNPPSITLTLND